MAGTPDNQGKVAIYARISLIGGDSVEHQIALLKEVIRARNLGEYEEEFIYQDVGISATKYSIWTRPAMKLLLRDAGEGKFRTVIFKGISRFARSTQEALDVLDRLKAKGLRVLSYEENYDSV
ncbi:MAG TPA: recombinase family protein, partial [Bacillota bacterium]|nr:recombinase family protein [Bacillota bacterium]